ncbi:MAG TPA: M20 family metallopeptidase [Rhizomicrobium sp.]|nr:M20 family metallopeptidase [Rhizomicrobium sp.]
MNESSVTRFMDRIWEDDILPTLTDYIRIPNKSPAFDAKWAEHGYMDKAVALFEAWAKKKLEKLPGAKLEVVRLKDRTPLIFIEIPGQTNDTVLLYGHLDKQPEMVGWAEGTGPWVPVMKDDKLYGRGGADDGYAMFASLAAILALHEQNIPQAHCVVLIEACEESGSYDLPAYIDHLSDRIGTPSLVVCLDSGCGDYERLWLTTSLRGIAAGTLEVRVLTEGVHSGDASGIVPSSFRILRQCLSRIEDETTGEIKLNDLFVQVPPDRLEQVKQSAKVLGDAVYSKMPFAGGTKPMSGDLTELVLNRTWRPQLAVIGVDGYPAPENAGNVLLPYSIAKLSFRLPPTCDAQTATQTIKRALEADAPYHAQIAFHAEDGQTGWNAPTLEPWLAKSISRASETHFGKPAAFMGEGGSIPFMAMLGEKFPKTQFVVTGVLGPHSNAHGPNEFLHIPTAKKVSAVIASVLADHSVR